jgi:hypothetical protein
MAGTGRPYPIVHREMSAWPAMPYICTVRRCQPGRPYPTCTLWDVSLAGHTLQMHCVQPGMKWKQQQGRGDSGMLVWPIFCLKLSYKNWQLTLVQYTGKIMGLLSKSTAQSMADITLTIHVKNCSMLLALWILWCGGVLCALCTIGIHALPMGPMESLVSFSVTAWMR